MRKSGLADSPFFTSPQKKTGAAPPSSKIPDQKEKKPKDSEKKESSSHDTTLPRHQDITVSRYQDTTTPRVHGVIIELVRKAVKKFGKEAATHRFTIDEKKEIADLIYTYQNQGIKTTENQITRIAVNFVMEDFRVNGENSVLYKVLEALNL